MIQEKAENGKSRKSEICREGLPKAASSSISEHFQSASGSRSAELFVLRQKEVFRYVLHTLRVMSENRKIFNRVEPRINSSLSREELSAFFAVS